MNEPISATPAWTRVLLVACCVAAVAMATLVVGPPSQAQTTTQRVITAEKGVVQSTVSGDGTLQPATQDDVNFQTSGTLENLYVSTGQQVSKGELLAELDPTAGRGRRPAGPGHSRLGRGKPAAGRGRSGERDLQRRRLRGDSGRLCDGGRRGPFRGTERVRPDVSATPSPRPRRQDRRRSTGGRAPPTGTTGASAVTSTTTVTATTPGPSPATHPSSAAGRRAAARQSGLSAQLGARGQQPGAGGNGAAGRAAGARARRAQRRWPRTSPRPRRPSPPPSSTCRRPSRRWRTRGSTRRPPAWSRRWPTCRSATRCPRAAQSSGASCLGASPPALRAPSARGTGARRRRRHGRRAPAHRVASSSSSPLVRSSTLSAMELVVPFAESDIGKVDVGQPATVDRVCPHQPELAAHVTTSACWGPRAARLPAMT